MPIRTIDTVFALHCSTPTIPPRTPSVPHPTPPAPPPHQCIPAQVPAYAAVVMSPFYDVASKLDIFAALLDRHIQYHSTLLGFRRHVLYVRASDVDLLSGHQRLAEWLKTGHLMLVLWKVGGCQKWGLIFSSSRAGI